MDESKSSNVVDLLFMNGAEDETWLPCTDCSLLFVDELAYIV